MSAYAGRYDELLLRFTGSGLAIPDTSVAVTVYEEDGTTEATLYTDRAKTDVGENPLAPDAAGNLEFYADPGTYVLSIAEDGIVITTNTVTVHDDPVRIVEWTAAASFEMTAVTYDATYTSVIAEADVVWPDGSAGTFTTTDINATWEAIDAFEVTHDDSGLTVTQPAVTRNAAGLVTVKPALTVS